MPFTLDLRLARDTREVGRLGLCRLLLMDDARFPWLILVPEREGAREVHELAPADRASLIEEVARVAEALSRLFRADKINVAALGNVVPQLHVHVVARYRKDPAWPGPVWGSGPAERYGEGKLRERLEELRGELGAWSLGNEDEEPPCPPG